MAPQDYSLCPITSTEFEAIGAGCGNSQGLKFLSKLEYDVWVELNRIRANPRSYIPHVQNKVCHPPP